MKDNERINVRNINSEGIGSNQKLSDPMLSEDLEKERYIWGWNSSFEVANDVWSSIHRSLLEGQLIFAYKSLSSNSELSQIVIVQNQDNTFGVGAMTRGFSYLLPSVPIEYLKTEVFEDLKKYKIDSKILETYKRIIKDKINN